MKAENCCWTFQSAKEFLASASLVINVKYYPDGMLETHRIVKALYARTLVVSEPGNDLMLREIYKEVVTFAIFGKSFVEAVKKVLALPESEKEKLRERNMKWIQEKASNLEQLCGALDQICFSN